MFHAVAQHDRKHCGAFYHPFPDISELEVFRL